MTAAAGDTTKINRARVLTLWAAVVAERLGFDHDEALTLGRAVAGLTAYVNGKSIGLFEPSPESLPHHFTQRGNRRAPMFEGSDDYRLYRDLLAGETSRANIEVWAWVLMPDHVHPTLVPGSADALAHVTDYQAGAPGSDAPPGCGSSPLRC